MPVKKPSANAAAPAADNPAFDASKAAAMPTPYRHEPTARTVAYEQPLGDGKKALFSATRVFVAVVNGEITRQEPAAPAPAVNETAAAE